MSCARTFPIALAGALLAALAAPAGAQQVAMTDDDAARMHALHEHDAPVPSGAVQPPRAEVVSDTVIYGTVDGKPLTGFRSRPKNGEEGHARHRGRARVVGPQRQHPRGDRATRRRGVRRPRGGPLRRQGGGDTRQRHRAHARRERQRRGKPGQPRGRHRLPPRAGREEGRHHRLVLRRRLEPAGGARGRVEGAGGGHVLRAADHRSRASCRNCRRRCSASSAARTAAFPPTA